ncbi:MAG: tetratricopeptide repeat protein [Myxococcota bacterium]
MRMASHKMGNMAWLMASLALASSGVVGCKSTQVEKPEPKPEPRPEPVHRDPPPPVDRGWHVSLGEIGWEVVPPEPPDRAFRANANGVVRHEKGDWQGSLPFFKEAVDIVSEYDLARYNLACAYSRVGDLDDALQELTYVLVRDLPRFKRYALEDQDLGNLRRAAQGTELKSRIDKLEDVWEQAMKIGTPTIAWREKGATDIGLMQGEQGQLLRPGVWLHEQERFVPAMQLVENAFSGMIDVERQQAIIVVANPTVDSPPLLEGAEVYVAPLVPAGEDPRKATITQDNLGTLEVYALDNGVRVRTNTTKSAWRELRAMGLVRAEDQHVSDRPVDRVTPDGSLMTATMPDGWEVKNRTLINGGREIQLQSGHSVANFHTMQIQDGGQWAVIVSVQHKCLKDEGPTLRHWVDRVDLSAGRAEGLSRDDGAAAAVFGRDGALYLQVGERTIRYATPGAASFETLPRGVLLMPFLHKTTCD